MKKSVDLTSPEREVFRLICDRDLGRHSDPVNNKTVPEEMNHLSKNEVRYAFRNLYMTGLAAFHTKSRSWEITEFGRSHQIYQIAKATAQLLS